MANTHLGRHLRMTALAILLTGLVLAPRAACAGEVSVAVAANFAEPAREIGAAFKARTGHDATLSFGASGQFYTQITHGAPFEVFLSADGERPARLEQEGLSLRGTRFTYAVGRLVLYSTTPGRVDARGAVLRRDDLHVLAIADPETAPYGLAAVQTMTRLGVWDRLKPRTVKGSSITQALQFVTTGSAELGFVALSQVINLPGGSRWPVPAADHDPILQQAVLLTPGARNAAAVAFMAFLRGPEARAIIKRYGYDLP